MKTYYALEVTKYEHNALIAAALRVVGEPTGRLYLTEDECKEFWGYDKISEIWNSDSDVVLLFSGCSQTGEPPALTKVCDFLRDRAKGCAK